MKDIEICNIALLQLGCEPISSFDEGTTEATIMSNLYQITKQSLLCKYPWRFCTFDADLACLSEKPKSDYKYIYQLPTNFLMVRGLRGSRANYEVDFGLAANHIVTDAQDVTLTYTCNIADNLLPIYFINVLANNLSARSCLALTEDTQKTSLWHKIFDDSYRDARSQDAQQATTQCFSSNILLDVRG